MSTFFGLKNGSTLLVISALPQWKHFQGTKVFVNFHIKYSNLKAQNNEKAMHFTGNVWNAEKKHKTKK